MQYVHRLHEVTMRYIFVCDLHIPRLTSEALQVAMVTSEQFRVRLLTAQSARHTRAPLFGCRMQR